MLSYKDTYYRLQRPDYEEKLQKMNYAKKGLCILKNILVNKYAAKKQQAKNRYPRNECLLCEAINHMVWKNYVNDILQLKQIK